MSVDVNSSLPPWKQAILERKRRVEEDDKRKQQEENDRLSQMPTWKRDILMKKQKEQKTKGRSYSSPNNNDTGHTNRPLSVVISHEGTSSQLSPSSPKLPDKPLSPHCRAYENDIDGICDGDSKGQDHVAPIQQNPWLKSKLRSPQQNDSARPNLTPSPTSNSHHSDDSQHNSSDLLKPDDDDDVFAQGGEVPYGRGFVHTLLKRFRHISAQTDTSSNVHPKKSTSPNRLPSGDVLTDTSYRKPVPQKASVYKYPEKHTSGLSRTKAISMDNLLMEFNAVESESPPTIDKLNSRSMENIAGEDVSNDAHDGVVKSCQESSEDGMPKHRSVSMTRDVFESISTPVNSLSAFNKPLKPKKQTVKSERKSVSDGKTSDLTDSGSSYDKTVAVSQSVEDKSLPEQSEILEEPAVIKGSSVASVKTSGRSWYFSGKDTRQKSVSNKYTPPISNGDQNANYAFKTNMNDSQRNSRAENIHSKTPVVNNTQSVVPPIENSTHDVLRSEEGWDNISDVGVMKQTEATTITSDGKRKPGITNSADPITNHHITKDKPTQEVEKVQDLKKPDLNRLNLNLEKLPQKTSTTDREPVAQKNQTPSIRNKSSRPPNSVKAQNKINKTSRTTEAKGPGSMLMRPASNLVVGSTKSEFLRLTKFNDVKTGDFAPATKRPGYYDTYSDSEEEDNVPVTNIDDCLPSDHTDLREGDANTTKSKSSKWEFTGAGVTVGKSSLQKSTKRNTLQLTFSSQSTTYEYPSEQSLLDSMPPQPGDYDHPDTIRQQGAVSPDLDDMPDPDQPITSLKSATTKLASDTLSSYVSKSAGDYQFGADNYQVPAEKKSDPPTPAPTQAPTAPDEDSTWSESSSADLLF